MNSVRLFQLPKVYLPGTSGGLVLTILLACVLGASPIARADSMTSDLDAVSFDLTELAICFSSTPGGLPCTLAIAPPGHPFGNVMIQDDIVNRFAGQVDFPKGTEGVRFTITNFLPFGMGAVAFNSPTFVTVSNDVIYDGQVFPVDATNHVPSPGGGEFFSNPISNINDCFTFQQGPFGCFANARTGLDVQHQLIFDVFHAYDPGALELQDVLGLSTVIPADLAPFPFEQTIARATIQIGGPAFEPPSFYFAGSPRPIPEPSSLLLLLGLLGVIGLLRVGKRRKLLRP